MTELYQRATVIGGMFAIIAGFAAYMGAVRAARMHVNAAQQQMASAQRSADKQAVALHPQIDELRTAAAGQER